MPDGYGSPGVLAVRRFRRSAARLVEIAPEREDLIDFMLFDTFAIEGGPVEPWARSVAREGEIVADLRRLRTVMHRTAWLCMPVDVPRIDLVKRCLDEAGYRKARLAHVVLEGRGEHEDGLLFHPIHNRLSHVVAAVGGRSRFRAYYESGILPLCDRQPHEAVSVELILRHCDDGDIIGILDGMLADVLQRFDLRSCGAGKNPLER